MTANQYTAIVWSVAGFQRLDRAPVTNPDDLLDLLAITWRTDQLLSDLTAGVLTPGLIITAPGMRSGVIVPDPDGGQMVKPLHEVFP